MEWMAPFAEAYGYTPAEFRSIRFSDFQLLAKHLNDRAERENGG